MRLSHRILNSTLFQFSFLSLIISIMAYAVWVVPSYMDTLTLDALRFAQRTQQNQTTITDQLEALLEENSIATLQAQNLQQENDTLQKQNIAEEVAALNEQATKLQSIIVSLDQIQSDVARNVNSGLDVSSFNGKQEAWGVKLLNGKYEEILAEMSTLSNRDRYHV